MNAEPAFTDEDFFLRRSVRLALSIGFEGNLRNEKSRFTSSAVEGTHSCMDVGKSLAS